MLFITLVDFVLGLFVGVYALASFSPPHLATKVYQSSWYVCIAFVALAYLQTQLTSDALPTARNLRAHTRFTPDDIQIFGIAVLLGIAIALIGGGYVLYKRSSTHAS